ncbi:MAG: YkgJ family cysteine cluster protein [Bacteroidota bacterium]
MPISTDELNKNAHKIERDSRKFFDRTLKFNKKAIDHELVELHDQVFEKMDCLTCANCCKTISPVFKDRDISRLADHFGVRPGMVVEKYLRLDDDGEYVPQTIPCPFIGEGNRCTVYDQRPHACRSYPHTDSLPLSKSTSLVVKNSAVCPAVYEMVKILESRHPIK